MTYLAPHAGRRCWRKPTGQVICMQGPAAIGAVEGIDPVLYLTAQVNRFTGPSAPPAYRMAEVPFPLAAGKSLDMAVAITAVTIFQRRAADAFVKNAGAAERDMIDRANTGFADPIGFVSANMAEVTDTLEHFADSLSLPQAKGVPAKGILARLHLSVPLAIGIGLVAAVLLGRR